MYCMYCMIQNQFEFYFTDKAYNKRMNGYSAVWQSWDLIQPIHLNPENTTFVESTDSSHNNSTEDVRQNVQRIRIDKRLSIPVLAAQIKCDANTLAAFERGDDILPHDVYKRLLKELKL